MYQYTLKYSISVKQNYAFQRISPSRYPNFVSFGNPRLMPDLERKWSVIKNKAKDKLVDIGERLFTSTTTTLLTQNLRKRELETWD